MSAETPLDPNSPEALLLKREREGKILAMKTRLGLYFKNTHVDQRVENYEKFVIYFVYF